MLNDLKNIILLLEKIQLHYQYDALTSKEIKEQLKRVEDFNLIFNEINLKLENVDINNICNIAETLFFIRSKLIDCDTKLNDIIELIEKSIQQYDISDC